MTLMDVLPLARRLNPDDRRALVEDMWRTLEGHDQIDPEVLDLVEQRAERVRQNPAKAIPWEEFDAIMNDRLGPVPA